MNAPSESFQLPRLRPVVSVAMLVVAVLAVPANNDVAAADGRAPLVAAHSQAAPVLATSATQAPARDGADAADAEADDGAFFMLLAALGAVGLMASRVRRPD